MLFDTASNNKSKHSSNIIPYLYIYTTDNTIQYTRLHYQILQTSQ